ncbi:MAG: sulfotransferase [Thiotrichaceae bacterium]|nr:sulfotransferase [Thiotrichaceae bacterium]PCI12186.1 MAG: sulfotransferase family protein [Thiotrichales bacterium]
MVAQVDRAYLGYGLGRMARRLVSYALFEGRALTTKGRWFNPIIFACLRALAKFPGEPVLRQPIFITGLGRSGTTILGILLSLHRKVGYLNEPKAIWHLINPSQDLNANYSSGGGVYRLTADDVRPEERLKAHRMFARYLALTGSKRVVDKYPELIFRVAYVREIFPDAKFIFITRSGADAVPSVVKWSERLGVKSEEHSDDWWGRNDIKWNYLREQLILTNLVYESIWPLVTPDLDHTNRAALEWMLTMREGLEQAQRYPDTVIRLSYEALLADPEGELIRLQQQCGLEPDSAVVDYAKKRLYDNPAKEWPALHPKIDVLFRATMTELGYETP